MAEHASKRARRDQKALAPREMYALYVESDNTDDEYAGHRFQHRCALTPRQIVARIIVAYSAQGTSYLPWAGGHSGEGHASDADAIEVAALRANAPEPPDPRDRPVEHAAWRKEFAPGVEGDGALCFSTKDIGGVSRAMRNLFYGECVAGTGDRVELVPAAEVEQAIADGDFGECLAGAACAERRDEAMFARLLSPEKLAAWNARRHRKVHHGAGEPEWFEPAELEPLAALE